ncbi:MAG: DUF1413 domain-containing protein [Nitrosomonadaceae bacterium]|nr:DUF1413 domain-containing protein [Nitrosomonadaceae bacterium]
MQLILEIVPALEPKQTYTGKMLCGKAFWDSLEKSERIRAGKCIVDMVRKNLLPLCFAGTTNANWHLYQLK